MADEVLVELWDDDPRFEPLELDRLTLLLREELLELDDVASVRSPTAGEAPAGSRGLDVAALGSLVVAVAPTVQALAKVLGVLRGWLGRRTTDDPRTLKVTVNGQVLELTPTAEQQQALVQAFIERAATSG